MGSSTINAAGPRRVWPGLLVIGIVVMLAIGCLFLARYLATPSEQQGQATQSSPRITPITPTTTALPTTTSSTVPEPPSLPQDFVAPGMPASFGITCGSESLISASSLTTTGESKVQRGNEVVVTPDVVGDTVAVLSHRLTPWAEMPGSNTETTTIVGHANYPQRMAFNPIAEHRGDTNDCHAVVTVPSGVLTYGFVQSHFVSKKWVSEVQALSGKDDTLLVATCFDNVRTIIWEFRLLSSRATS